jgi:hypothetical protein
MLLLGTHILKPLDGELFELVFGNHAGTGRDSL